MHCLRASTGSHFDPEPHLTHFHKAGREGGGREGHTDSIICEVLAHSRCGYQKASGRVAVAFLFVGSFTRKGLITLSGTVNHAIVYLIVSIELGCIVAYS